MNEKGKRILRIIICVFVILKTISIINMYIVNDLSILGLWPAFITAVPAIFLFFFNISGTLAIVVSVSYILIILVCTFILMFKKKMNKVTYIIVSASLWLEGFALVISSPVLSFLPLIGAVMNFVAAYFLVYINNKLLPAENEEGNINYSVDK